MESILVVLCLAEYSGRGGEGGRRVALLSLEELAARRLIATRRNFYAVRALAPRLKDYLTQIAQSVEVTSFLFQFFNQSVVN